MRSHLKVKVYILSKEMTYIRRQEVKWKAKAKYARERVRKALDAEIAVKAQASIYAAKAFWSHRDHRIDLKIEARNTHLAYGFMKGLPYSKMEVICYGPLKGYGGSEPDWSAISSMVERFSKDEAARQGIMQKFSEWLAEAKLWYEGNPDRIKAMWEAQKTRVWPVKKSYTRVTSS